MNAFELISALLVGYVLGSISWASIIARRHGVDILTEGSGNPGATNVKRVIGKKAGNLCFTLDALKGVFAAGWPMLPFLGATYPVSAALAGLVGALVGHSLSMFINFKGGKGVAVTMGGLLVVMPYALLIGVVVWLGLFYASRYVSLASIGFGISLPISAAIFHLSDSPERFWFAVLVAVAIVVRHRANISRLVQGKENRFTRRPVNYSKAEPRL